MKKALAIAFALALSITMVGVASGDAVGVTWQNHGARSTGGLSSHTPTSIQYWSGYRSYSQGGAYGRHIYASTDYLFYNHSRVSWLEAYYQANSGTKVPTTIHFDDQAVGGGVHYGGIHATTWYYANVPNPEYDSDDDDGDTRHEEVEVRWNPTSPSFVGGSYNIEVEYWDPLFDPDTGAGNWGDMNVSAYITTAIGGYPVPGTSTWMCKFGYPKLNGHTWLDGCG